jgi:hypothetical protein
MKFYAGIPLPEREIPLRPAGGVKILRENVVMKKQKNSVCPMSSVFVAFLLLLALPACSSQPPASAPSGAALGVMEDELTNSLHTIPHVVMADSNLYYINASANPEEKYTLYTMKVDGSRRRPLLTQEQGLKSFRKIKQDTKTFYPRNIQTVKDGRIIFVCDTLEKAPGGEDTSEVYVCSVDLAGNDMQVVEDMQLKVSDVSSTLDWYLRNDGGTMSYMLKGYMPPIIKDGWRYNLDEKEQLVREKPDGTDRQVLYDKIPVSEFALQDNWIYFTTVHNDCIYRMSIYGESGSPLKDPLDSGRKYHRFRVYGEWIYYLTNVNSIEGFLPTAFRRLKTDGSADELIPTKYYLYSFQIIEGQVFYTYEVPDKTSPRLDMPYYLRCMNLDGTGDRAIDTPQKEKR